MHKTGFAFLAAVAVFSAGCGGGGGSSPQVSNAFAGTYLGEYIDGNGKAGVFQFVVSNSGVVSGTYFTGIVAIGSASGRIDKDGHGTMTFAGLQSDIQLDNNGEHTSTLSITPVQGGTPGTAVVLVPNPSGLISTNSAFTGRYAAVLTDTTTNQVAALGFTIDSGVLSGTEITINNGTFTTSTIVGTVTPAGAISLSLPNQVTATGSLSIAGFTTGNLQLSNGDSAKISMSPYTTVFGPPPPRNTR